jgi:hypothetical protein
MENSKNIVNDSYLRDKVFKNGKFMKRREKVTRWKYFDWRNNLKQKNLEEAYLESYSRNVCKASNKYLFDWC